MLNIVENIMSLTFLLSLKTTPSAGVDRKYIELSGLEAYGLYLITFHPIKMLEIDASFKRRTE